jgi:hypothetical protein
LSDRLPQDSGEQTVEYGNGSNFREIVMFVKSKGSREHFPEVLYQTENSENRSLPVLIKGEEKILL